MVFFKFLFAQYLSLFFSRKYTPLKFVEKHISSFDLIKIFILKPRPSLNGREVIAVRFSSCRAPHRARSQCKPPSWGITLLLEAPPKKGRCAAQTPPREARGRTGHRAQPWAGPGDVQVVLPLSFPSAGQTQASGLL